ncbi:MAG: hypothetical protein JXB42_10130 [Deltaproteobacteria bacterium]|nr:hypothetical protein [Deltaproteobacteria bacterium]
MKKTENARKDIAQLLKKAFVLLKKTQPVSDEFDTVWAGPYFISRPKKWHPTRFLLYKDHLYCNEFFWAWVLRQATIW